MNIEITENGKKKMVSQYDIQRQKALDDFGELYKETYDLYNELGMCTDCNIRISQYNK